MVVRPRAMTFTKKSFRLILLLALAFNALGVWMHYLTRASLPPEVQTFLRHQHSYPFSVHEKLSLACFSIYVIACAVCFVGLFLFRPFSRKLFVVLIFAGILLDPFLSLQMRSGWEAFDGDCLGALNALIFFVIYFSSLKEQFVRKI
jgi:hypothetical protein